MATITITQANARFGGLLNRVSRGEEIVITKYSKPVARIVPATRPDLEQIRQAVDGLRALRNRMAARKGFKPLTDMEIRDAVPVAGHDWRTCCRLLAARGASRFGEKW